jgi:NTE family protein
MRPLDDASPLSLTSARGTRPREGVALCLSGGGFRAALFHLGALRRLNELGVLSGVDTISAVSGGSLIAAHLAGRVPVWPVAGEMIPDWDSLVAGPFHAFSRRNLRTGPLLQRALPANWFRPDSAIEALARRLREDVVGMALAELPDHPRYIFSATDMTFGANWIFERSRIGDFQAGYLTPDGDWSVARAVAASSCFPPVFSPMRPDVSPGQLRGGGYRRADRDTLVAGLQLTDGGTYDNMALEPVWKRHRTVLVSDGGAVFDCASSSSAMRRLLRYPAIVGKQATALRRRWLIAGFRSGTLDGVYWSVSNSGGAEGFPRGYPAGFVDETISAVRTDLDAFSGAEIAVLENHGYLVADRAVRTRAPHLVTRDAPPRVPFPEWLDADEKVRSALRGSDRRTLLGRR